MKVLVFLVILALIDFGAAIEASPRNPDPGETITITGIGSPGEAVKLSSSFEMSLPVESGRYEYVAKDVEIPQKPNRLSVTARNVEDLNVGIKMGIWLNMPIKAKGGTASISKSDVPPGRYTLKIFGNSAGSASAVSVTVNAETTVYADSGGKYTLSMDTSGIPEGEYKIKGAGETIVLNIGGLEKKDPASKDRKSDRILLIEGTEPITYKESTFVRNVIPDPYYVELKKADANNPDEMVRYCYSMRSYTTDLDAFERAAFYERQLTGCGFNVSFAYTENFDGKNKEHIWLLVKTIKGEIIEIDPSYKNVGRSSILPLGPEYSRYDLEFEDIYQASDNLGIDRVAWWAEKTTQQVPVQEVTTNESIEKTDAPKEPTRESGMIERIVNFLYGILSSFNRGDGSGAVSTSESV